MQTSILYVFSGTGNTLKIAELYRAAFLNRGVDCTIHSVTRDFSAAPNPNGYDLVGFAYPIHAFNPPKIFLDFLQTLPAVAGKKEPKKAAFLFKTSGEPLALNRASSRKVIKILRKKGFEIFGERHVIMPYNMIFRHPDAMVKQMYAYARALVPVYADEVLDGMREKLKIPVPYKLNSMLFCVEHPFARLNGRFFRVDSEKCVVCGLCASACPEDNIRIEDGKIKFGKNCALCVRCSFRCPTDAIKIGILNGWRVNGDYLPEKKLADESIPFPFVTEKTKGGYRVYKKYFRNADKLLSAHGISLPEPPASNAKE